MKNRGLKTILTVSLFLLISSASWGSAADVYGWWSALFQNYEDPNAGMTVFQTLKIPMGGAYEGMGTAYAAVARDGGFLESNPSGSSLLRTGELSFYHHSWIADSNLEGVVYTLRFDDLGIGFGGKFLYVPFTAYNEWGAAGSKDYITETIGILNLSYNFLSSYSFYGLALGTNVKVAYRGIPAVFATNQSALALITDLGVQTSFNFLKFFASQSRNFSVGAVIKNLGISTLSDETLPQTLTVGAAWSPLRPWLIAADFNLPFSFAGQPPAEVWNLALGTTVDMTSFLSVQAGVLMKADNPRVSVGTSLNLGTLSLDVNYNLDLSGQLNPVDKFSVQARFDLGDAGRGARQKQVESLYTEGLGEYANHNYRKAVDLWQEVLTLDPKYQPAADYILTAQKALALQDELSNRDTP
jgi:hypothetical protein